MPKKKARSIRGETVDFDLLKVKQSIESRNKPESAELRERYIDIRRRRNPRRNVSDLVREQNQNAADARDKIEQSKRNALKAAEAAENAPKEEPVDDTPVEVADVVEVPAEMGKTVVEPTATTAAKKRIVKKTSKPKA